MLVLTRKLMEKLFIGDDICVTVVRLEGGQVRLGIDAPRDVAVVRAELVPSRPLPCARPGCSPHPSPAGPAVRPELFPRRPLPPARSGCRPKPAPAGPDLTYSPSAARAADNRHRG